MTYEDALTYISSLAPRGWRLGLDRMHAFAEAANLSDAIGKSPLGPKFVQVAGTNGKGSTTAYLQSLMVHAGYKTGAYFSPYVYDPRERIQIGQSLIPKEDFAEATSKLRPIAESFTDSVYEGISEFEFKTAMGLLYWKQQNVEWVALEVGLGGKLDATTIVTPRAGIITSIGLDHTSILGNTLEEIAYEKAGIAKPGMPLILGELPPVALRTIEDHAKEVGSPTWKLGKDIILTQQRESYTVQTPGASYAGLCHGIPGTMQAENMALAIAAFEAAGATFSLEQVQLGVKNAFIPGRFERRTYQGRLTLLDGAHNGEAASVLAQSLKQTFPNQKFALVTAMVAGHDPVRFYEALKDVVEEVFVVPLDFHRAYSVPDLLIALSSLFPTTGHESVEAGLAAAQASGLPVLVTGSFYVLGEASDFCN